MSEEELLKFLRDNTLMQSLLYDLGLLPEMLRPKKDAVGWSKMLCIAEHFKKADEMHKADIASLEAALEEAKKDAAQLELDIVHLVKALYKVHIVAKAAYTTNGDGDFVRRETIDAAKERLNELS